MQLALVIAISLHILAATFWAGSTFTLARTAGNGSDQLFVPQLSSAVLAIGAGAYLWYTLHDGPFGTAEQWLAAGAWSAILALAIQAVVVGAAQRQLRKPGKDTARARSRIAIAYRVTAFLLAIAAVAMAASRYA
ncbi:hypothetical protein [Bradyrhizobium liaoningense]|uniref:hypothetical protein n=1 Tax=Bradyrhizobium liaoningense TaxID=43992 RepID=UPI001BADD5FC|nr:hypothetical protein [Bradyrhizobium liaoningense]MBR0719525.1 hypothetical protein [Bradyrhizobium liaoningense]